jgi:outer membrane protein with beta-barrel domain
MKRIAAVIIVTLCAGSSVFAQESRWTVEFAVGGAAPTDDLSGRLTTGWDVNAGVGYRFRPWFTLMSEFDFAGMGIPDDVLAEAQAPEGHGHLFSLNLEPQVHFPIRSRLSGFVEGGGGWIRRNVAFTQPGVENIDVLDPFYGDYVAQVGTDIVLSSTTRNAFGANLGGGIAKSLADTGAELFVDVRYYYAATSPRVTAMVPIMFGIRYIGKQ